MNTGAIVCILQVAFSPTTCPETMLNPNLNKQELASRFDLDGRIRVADILDTEIAERVRRCCLTDVHYEYLSHFDGKNIAVPAGEMAKLGSSEREEFLSKVLAAASAGVGFFYCGYMMVRAQKDTDNESLQFLHSIFEFLNSEQMLSFISEITGRDDLKSADAQYTRYTPGQFLTRHRDDDITSEKRRLAYVLSFSKNWHPDWGGLLQFYEDDGTPRDAWTPTFNTMSIFDVRHAHSVTYVTPFAKEPRLSLTGWFRAKA